MKSLKKKCSEASLLVIGQYRSSLWEDRFMRDCLKNPRWIPAGPTRVKTLGLCQGEWLAVCVLTVSRKIKSIHMVIEPTHCLRLDHTARSFRKFLKVFKILDTRSFWKLRFSSVCSFWKSHLCDGGCLVIYCPSGIISNRDNFKRRWKMLWNHF